MDKIYKHATSVLVWLGCHPYMIEAVRRLRDLEDHEGWAIDTLLSHTYFTRIWIIQEITFSVNEPLIICGGVELGKDRIRFAKDIPYRGIPLAALAIICGYNRIRGRRTLQECIGKHCEGKCHDPRDKVYGLLSLTPEKWRVRVDYMREVLEVYFDAVAALYEELFDLTDPECLYPKFLKGNTIPENYRGTLLFLGKAMGFPQRHLGGLRLFLHYCLAAYLKTTIRNVQYTYTGRIYTRVQVQSSSEQILALEEGEEAEVEVSWGSITATRRNPLMRDVIPEMGLQLARTTTESTAEQSGDSVPVLDRWWCKHGGEIHYFDCFDPCLDVYSDDGFFG